MIYILSIIFVLGVLIFVHELGHFLAAKLFGVRVERFSIGFPPRIISKKIGDTEYCISAIPLGGYVKMSGMIDESLDENNLTGAPHEFMSKPTWQKAIILCAGVFMNFLLAVFLFGMLTWSQGEAVIPTNTIGRVAPGSIADSLGFQAGDKLLKINDNPVNNWNDVGRSFLQNLGSPITYTIERNGQIKSIVLNTAHLKIQDIRRLGMNAYHPAEVGQLAPDYPAARAGLQEGDRIIAINDSAIADWYAMSEIVSASPGKPLNFRIQRGDQTLEVQITPQPVTIQNPGGTDQKVGRIGITYPIQHIEVAFLPAMAKGFQESVFWAETNIQGFSRLLTGKDSPKETLAGPLAITKLAGDAAQQDFLNLIRLIAILSVVLAIINILPIPALDGGHLVIVLIEGAMRKPLPVKVKMAIQQVGMAFLFLLMIFIFYNDILRFF